MITYLSIKRGIEEAYDLEEFIFTLITTPMMISLDLILILFQPILYLIYKKWQKERER